MAQTNQTTQTKKANVPVSPDEYQALMQLRDDLDGQSTQAIEAGKTYIAGVLTEIVVFVDNKLLRADRYSRRIANAQKRSKVKELRKAEREGTQTQSPNANSSRASA